MVGKGEAVIDAWNAQHTDGTEKVDGYFGMPAHVGCAEPWSRVKDRVARCRRWESTTAQRVLQWRVEPRQQS